MYSPKIDEKHIPVLYRIGRERKKPITHLVNEAITEYLNKATVSPVVGIDSDKPSANVLQS